MTWYLELGSIKLYLACKAAIAFASDRSKNHLVKVIKDVLDYAIDNTGIESLSVEILENIKMRNVITKAIEDYRQCALSADRLYHIRLVAKSQDRLLLF